VSSFRTLTWLRQKTNLFRPIKVILAVQSLPQKDLPSQVTQITSDSAAVPAFHEGRIAIVTDVGRGMRWTLSVRQTNALGSGRSSRVVLTPRRWRQAGRRCFASWPATVARKPGSPGRPRSKPLKPLRGECRNVSADLWWTCSCAFFTCTRGYGCGERPAFPAPSCKFGRRLLCITRAHCVAGMRRRALSPSPSP
jgi:hypothetical protein